jgi:flagellar biosynthesis/type III secretory pathway M-ring protein FliF/YscJ
MNEHDDRSHRYPTQASGSIPAFHNTEEEAEWWDTHDTREIWDELEPVEVQKTLEEKIQIRLDTAMSNELEQYARRAGMKKATLVRQWLRERLQQEQSRRKAS